MGKRNETGSAGTSPQAKASAEAPAKMSNGEFQYKKSLSDVKDMAEKRKKFELDLKAGRVSKTLDVAKHRKNLKEAEELLNKVAKTRSQFAD